jgi:hypothetical protein
MSVGLTYSFILVTTNAFGPSPNSTVLQVLIATIPSKMTPVVINQGADHISANLTFTAPSSNGSPISAY